MQYCCCFETFNNNKTCNKQVKLSKNGKKFVKKILFSFIFYFIWCPVFRTHFFFIFFVFVQMFPFYYYGAHKTPQNFATLLLPQKVHHQQIHIKVLFSLVILMFGLLQLLFVCLSVCLHLNVQTLTNAPVFFGNSHLKGMRWWWNAYAAWNVLYYAITGFSRLLKR